MKNVVLNLVLAQSSVQKGALWWCAHHRYHHKHSDHMDDVHSVSRHGFFYAHFGWILTNKNMETRYDLIPDLAKYPELVFLNKHSHIATWMWVFLKYSSPVSSLYSLSKVPPVTSMRIRSFTIAS